ncbi:MAG: CorA family divalent cation transporter [Deltaproteobacteria bacterium]|nr:CorA family divalent cation transporter [Deltaproteobacteria bacterium]
MGDALFDTDHQLLPGDWDLPVAIRSRLGHTVGRQRIMQADGHLLVIVHRVPGPEDDQRTGCLVWRDATGRWRSVDGPEGRVALRELIDEYEAGLSALDERIEEPIPLDGHFEILERLAPILRAARHVHSTLQQARDACPNDRSLIDLRDLAYAVERRAELLSGDARFALDRALARSSHAHTMASRDGAEAAERLNRLAAVFLPMGTAAALLGMNVPSGLEGLRPPWPFVLILAIGLVVGLVLSRRIHRPAQDASIPPAPDGT